MDEHELQLQIAAIAQQATLDVFHALDTCLPNFGYVWNKADTRIKTQAHTSVRRAIGQAMGATVATVSTHLTTAYTEATDGS